MIAENKIFGYSSLNEFVALDYTGIFGLYENFQFHIVRKTLAIMWFRSLHIRFTEAVEN